MGYRVRVKCSTFELYVTPGFRHKLPPNMKRKRNMMYLQHYNASRFLSYSRYFFFLSFIINFVVFTLLLYNQRIGSLLFFFRRICDINQLTNKRYQENNGKFSHKNYCGMRILGKGQQNMKSRWLCYFCSFHFYFYSVEMLTFFNNCHSTIYWDKATKYNRIKSNKKNDLKEMYRFHPPLSVSRKIFTWNIILREIAFTFKIHFRLWKKNFYSSILQLCFSPVLRKIKTE